MSVPFFVIIPGTHGRDRKEALPDEPEDNKVSTEWWGDSLSEEDRYKVELGGKIVLLAEILKMCESIGDKV